MYQKVTSHFRTKFIAGLIVLVPLVITFLVLRFLVSSIDGFLQPILKLTLGRQLPGAGLVIILFLVYLAGLLATNVIGSRLLRRGQNALLRIPIVKTIYYVSRQLVSSLSGNEVKEFKRVVAIEHPRKGLWAIGFVTATTKDQQGRVFHLVYIPTAPIPASGWITLVPEEQTYELDLSVPAALQLIASIGFLTPETLKKVTKQPVASPNSTTDS